MPRIYEFIKRNNYVLITIGLAFAVATILSYFFANNSIRQLKTVAMDRFRIQVNSVVYNSTEKYQGGLTTLRSLQAFFVGSEKVTRAEFYDFIRSSDFFNAYPGFSAFAYAKRIDQKDKDVFIAEVRSDKSVNQDGYPAFSITPEGDRMEYWPITYVSPESELQSLLGSDQFADPLRGENISRGRDQGSPSLSKTISLRQGGAGVVIAAPLYKGKAIPQSIDQRRALFDGAVTVSLRMSDFFSSILSSFNLQERGYSIAITGRGGDKISVLTSVNRDSMAARVFGMLETTETISLGDDSVEINFRAPAGSQLTSQEIYEPVLLILLLYLLAAVIAFIVIVVQKSRASSDLKRHYTFITTLSHQLRTPLTNMRWYLELGKSPKHDKKAHKLIFDSVIVLNSIIGRMLQYIDMNKNGALVHDLKEVGIETMYKKTLESISPGNDISRIDRFGDKKIKQSVLIDEDQMVIALGYIIENALVYSPKKQKVSVGLTVQDKTLNIEVIDHGYGIPKNEQDKVFTDFFRATNASLGVNYGSGVSTYIAKKIIDAHAGTIAFSSREGEGTTFTIRLPLAP